MHLTPIGVSLLAAIALVLSYLVIKGPPKISDQVRNSEVLFWFTMALLVCTAGLLLGLIGFILYLISHLF